MIEFLSLFVKLLLIFLFILSLLKVFLQHQGHEKLTTFLKYGAVLGSITSLIIYCLKKYWMRMEYLDVVEKGIFFFAILLLFIWFFTQKRLIMKKLCSAIIFIFSFSFALIQVEQLLLVSIPQFSMANGLNTEWITRIALFMTAILFLVLMSTAMSRIGLRMDKKFVSIIFISQFSILLFYQLVELLQLMISLQLLPLTMWALEILGPLVNHKDYFVLIVVILTALFLFFLALCIERQPKIKELTFTNPAEKRKLFAERKRINRWLFSLAAVQILMYSFLIGAHVIHAKEQKGQPPIKVTDIDGHIHIEKDQLIEKKMNLFSYMHHDGTESQFLIVGKTKENLGVGLDACAICGVAGYYQKGDHIICKKCDSVININTIGFTGGCNPIPLPYEKSVDGSLNLNVNELEKYMGLFQ